MTPFVRAINQAKVDGGTVINVSPYSMLNSYYPLGSHIYKTQPAVRTVVSFIARQLASLPLHVYELSEDRERLRVEDGDLVSLLADPNPDQDKTKFSVFYSFITDYLVSGRAVLAYTLFGRGPKARTGLRRIPPELLSFRENAFGELTGVQVVNTDSSTSVYDPKQFVILRGHLDNSPVQTLKRLLDEYTDAVDYRQAVYKNSAVVPMYIQRDKPWSEEARRRFVESWATYKPSGGNAGGTPVLEDGMKIETLPAHKPLEVNDLAQRELTLVEVCNAFHIPPELIGARQGTYSNIEAMQNTLFNVALLPYLIELEDCLNKCLVGTILELDSSTFIEANINAKLRGSYNQQMASYSRAAGRPFMTVNEIRKLENLEPLPQGDELATPLNVALGTVPNPLDTGGGRPTKE